MRYSEPCIALVLMTKEITVCILMSIHFWSSLNTSLTEDKYVHSRDTCDMSFCVVCVPELQTKDLTTKTATSTWCGVPLLISAEHAVDLQSTKQMQSRLNQINMQLYFDSFTILGVSQDFTCKI